MGVRFFQLWKMSTTGARFGHLGVKTTSGGCGLRANLGVCAYVLCHCVLLFQMIILFKWSWEGRFYCRVPIPSLKPHVLENLPPESVPFVFWHLCLPVLRGYDWLTVHGVLQLLTRVSFSTDEQKGKTRGHVLWSGAATLEPGREHFWPTPTDPDSQAEFELEAFVEVNDNMTALGRRKTCDLLLYMWSTLMRSSFSLLPPISHLAIFSF